MASPIASATAVYARLQYEEPVWRHWLDGVWQPAQYYLEYRAHVNAAAQRFRVVPEIARGGFLLLPILTDADALAEWIEHPQAPIATDGEWRFTDRSGTPVAARLTLCPSIACTP